MTVYTDPAGDQYDSWDQDPVIQLGNAWITFGDLLDLQLSNMTMAQFNLINGAWMGTASMSMSDAYYSMQPVVQQVVENCWDMGEMINYYALMRSAQEATEAKEELEEELLAIFAVVLTFLAPFLDFGALIADALAGLARLFGLTEELAAATKALTAFLDAAPNYVLSSVGVDADTLTIPSWLSTMANVTANVAKFSIEYTAINAVMNSAAAGIAGLPVGKDQLSPIPTNATGAAELLSMVALVGFGKFAEGGVDVDVDSNDDVNVDPDTGNGVNVPNVNVHPTSSDVPEVGSAGGSGQTTDHTPESITNHDATIADGDTNVAAPGFGDPVTHRTDPPVSESAVDTNMPSVSGIRNITPVSSDPVKLDTPPSADAGFKNDVVDTSSTPTTGNPGTTITANLDHNGPVSSDPETRTPTASTLPSDQGTPVAHESTRVTGQTTTGGAGTASAGGTGRDTDPVTSSPRTASDNVQRTSGSGDDSTVTADSTVTTDNASAGHVGSSAGDDVDGAGASTVHQSGAATHDDAGDGGAALTVKSPSSGDQAFRTDTLTGARQLVTFGESRFRGTGQRLGGGDGDEAPGGAAQTDGTATDGTATDSAGRYRYHDVDPETGAATEFRVNQDAVVTDVQPAGGRVYGTDSERFPVFDQATGRWDVATVSPTAEAGRPFQVIAPANRTFTPDDGSSAPVQMLYRDPDGGISLLTYGDHAPMTGTGQTVGDRPAAEAGTDTGAGPGEGYRNLDGSDDGWRAGSRPPGQPEVQKISSGNAGHRLDGQPVTREPEFLARDLETNRWTLVEKAPGEDAGPAGRSYFRPGADGRLEPVAVRADPLEVLRVDPDTGDVQRVDVTPSGEGDSGLSLGSDGTLTDTTRITTGDLRADPESGELRVESPESAESAGPTGGSGHESGAGAGGGPGTATRPGGGDSQTQVQLAPVRLLTGTDTRTADSAVPDRTGDDPARGDTPDAGNFTGQGRPLGDDGGQPALPGRAERAAAFQRFKTRATREGGTAAGPDAGAKGGARPEDAQRTATATQEQAATVHSASEVRPVQDAEDQSTPEHDEVLAGQDTVATPRHDTATPEPQASAPVDPRPAEAPSSGSEVRPAEANLDAEPSAPSTDSGAHTADEDAGSGLHDQDGGAATAAPDHTEAPGSAAGTGDTQTAQSARPVTDEPAVGHGAAQPSVVPRMPEEPHQATDNPELSDDGAPSAADIGEAAPVTRADPQPAARPEGDVAPAVSTPEPGSQAHLPTPAAVTAQVDAEVGTLVAEAQNRYAVLFDGAAPQEYFAFLAAQAHLQAHETVPGGLGVTVPGSPGVDAGIRQDPAEAAWQAWLTWAREQFPGTAPVRPAMTLAEAVDWTSAHAHAMATEAAGNYMVPFDSAGGQQYVNFHWQQAREQARNMVLSDLGVNVQHWLGGDAGSQLAPDQGTTPLTPEAHQAAIDQALPDQPGSASGSGTFPGMHPHQLPTHAHGIQTLPVLSRGAVVPGLYSGEPGEMFIDGQSRSPVAAAAWIRRWTSLSDDDMPGPVVLLGGGAGDSPGHGSSFPEFAASLAAELGVPVIAASGSVLQTPEGMFYAGTAVTGDDGRPALVNVGGDSWVIYQPDGSAHPAAPELETVMTWLGVGLEPPERNPEVPTLWNHGVLAPARGDSGTNVYPEIPLGTWLTAASLVQRWDHYRMVLETGVGTVAERYQRHQDVAAVAQVILNGSRGPLPSAAEPDPAIAPGAPWGGLAGGDGDDVEMPDATAGPAAMRGVLTRPAAGRVVLAGSAADAGGSNHDMEMTDAPPLPAVLDALERWFSRLQGSDPAEAARIRQDVEQTAVALREFDEWMRANEFGYRFGGSLSALLQGAPRLPEDVDIEVTNRANMQALHREIAGLGGGWSFQSSVAPDGEVIAIFAQHRGMREMSFDIVNETHPVAFGQAHHVHEMMQLEGDAVESGDLVPPDELILNYLDRMLKKPQVAAEKNDPAQIVGLLRGAGVSSLEGAAQFWDQYLAQAVRNDYPLASELRETFRSIVLANFPGDAPGPGAAAARWGQGPAGNPAAGGNLAAAEQLARQLGQRRGAGGPHAGLPGGSPAAAGGGDGDDVEMTDAPTGPTGPTAVGELARWFAGLERSDPAQAARIRQDVEQTAVALREFDEWMRANEFGYRFGGSLSALLQGAPRLPEDVDIEVTNRANMQALHREIAGLGGGWSFQSSVAPDGEVIAIFAQHRGMREMSFDIVNETHPVAFGQAHHVHEMMQLEGDAVESGDLVPPDELILNYLDRMLKKPQRAAEKNDPAQIVGLLRGAGVSSLEGAAQFWDQHLASAIKDDYFRAGELGATFRSIVLSSFTGGAPGPGAAAAHWGPAPATNHAPAEDLARQLGQRRGVGGPHGGPLGGSPTAGNPVIQAAGESGGTAASGEGSAGLPGVAARARVVRELLEGVPTPWQRLAAVGVLDGLGEPPVGLFDTDGVFAARLDELFPRGQADPLRPVVGAALARHFWGGWGALRRGAVWPRAASAAVAVFHPDLLVRALAGNPAAEVPEGQRLGWLDEGGEPDAGKAGLVTGVLLDRRAAEVFRRWVLELPREQQPVAAAWLRRARDLLEAAASRTTDAGLREERLAAARLAWELMSALQPIELAELAWNARLERAGDDARDVAAVWSAWIRAHDHLAAGPAGELDVAGQARVVRDLLGGPPWSQEMALRMLEAAPGDVLDGFFADRPAGGDGAARDTGLADVLDAAVTDGGLRRRLDEFVWARWQGSWQGLRSGARPMSWLQVEHYLREGADLGIERQSGLVRDLLADGDWHHLRDLLASARASMLRRLLHDARLRRELLAAARDGLPDDTARHRLLLHWVDQARQYPLYAEPDGEAAQRELDEMGDFPSSLRGFLAEGFAGGLPELQAGMVVPATWVQDGVFSPSAFYPDLPAGLGGRAWPDPGRDRRHPRPCPAPGADGRERARRAAGDRATRGCTLGRGGGRGGRRAVRR